MAAGKAPVIGKDRWKAASLRSGFGRQVPGPAAAPALRRYGRSHISLPESYTTRLYCGLLSPMISRIGRCQAPNLLRRASALAALTEMVSAG